MQFGVRVWWCAGDALVDPEPTVGVLGPAESCALLRMSVSSLQPDIVHSARPLRRYPTCPNR